MTVGVDTRIGQRACPICDARQPRAVLRKDGWPVVRCQSCGLVYVDATLDRAALEEFYDQGYFEGDVFAAYTSERDARLREGRARVRRLARVAPGGRLLDVGCAAGFFLAAATERYDAHGVELSDYAARYAREELGLNVVTGDLADAALPDASFDVVTLWDTIEHLVEPAATAREIARITRPGGTLAISTGNVESRLARRGLERWSLMAPPGHLLFFSPATLGRLLSDHGFRIVRRDGDGIVSTRPRLRRLPVTAPLGRLGIGNVMTVYACKK